MEGYTDSKRSRTKPKQREGTNTSKDHEMEWLARWANENAIDVREFEIDRPNHVFCLAMDCSKCPWMMPQNSNSSNTGCQRATERKTGDHMACRGVTRLRSIREETPWTSTIRLSSSFRCNRIPVVPKLSLIGVLPSTTKQPEI